VSKYPQIILQDFQRQDHINILVGLAKLSNIVNINHIELFWRLFIKRIRPPRNGLYFSKYVTIMMFQNASNKNILWKGQSSSHNFFLW